MTEPELQSAHRFLDRAANYALRVPVAKRRIRIGPVNVSIQVPGVDQALADYFLGAFYNEVNPDAGEEFTIRVFDDADGCTTAVFPFDERLVGVTGKCTLPGKPPLKLAVNPIIGSISILDWKRRELAVWVRSFQCLPYWYVATPLRNEIADLADSLGMDFVHAGGLGRRGRGIALVGRSGSGKSTTILRGVAQGLQTVGDDFLLTDGKRLYGVYGRAKALRDAQQFAGNLSAAIVAGQSEDKLILDMARLGDREALVPEMEIAVICIPMRDGGHLGLAPARRIDVARELLIHTSVGLREVYPASLHRIRTLVQNVPCWNWFLGREGSWLEDTIDALIDPHVRL